MTKHVLPSSIDPAFCSEVLKGLTAPRKSLSSKWLYDTVGSHLFDAITALDAYYPTRTEISILRRKAASFARLPGAQGALVELGSGSSRKTGLLLDAFPDLKLYMPVDISASHLAEAAERMRRSYPSLAVAPVTADFTQPLTGLPVPEDLPVLVFFPGSTIGNFEVPEAADLLQNIRSALPGATLIVGVDRPKDETVLVTAYDDPAGVTAAFNLNLLQRLNRDLGADFNLKAFAHRALWNRSESRIEMHLESLTDQTVALAGKEIPFAAGETIHTENSHKYDENAFARITTSAGWRITGREADERDWFSLYTLQAL